MVRFIRLGRIGLRIRAGAKAGPSLIILFGLITSATLSAQTFQVSASGNWGLGYQLNEKNVYEPGFNGGGVRLDQVQYITNTNISFLNGFEYSFLGWGSQLLVSNGFSFRIYPQVTWDEESLKTHPGKFSIDARLYAMNGILLLRPKVLYTGAIQIDPVLTYQLNRKIALHLAAGYRYSLSPGYRDYCSIWSYSDVPISLGISWRYD